MSNKNSRNRQGQGWATQSAVFSTDNASSRSFFTSVDQSVRSSTASLENWHWGSMSGSPFKSSPNRPLSHGWRGRQQMKETAALQSSMALPHVEPAAYSPRLDLGDRLKTGRFSEVSRSSSDQTNNQAQGHSETSPSKSKQRATGRDVERNSVGSRDSLYQILARRGGQWSRSPSDSPASVNGRQWLRNQAPIDSPSDRLHGWASPESYQGSVPSFMRRSKADDVKEFPISLDSSMEADTDSDVAMEATSLPDKGSPDDTAESRPGSWTHAWTPPSESGTPKIRSRPTSLARIRAKFRRNSRELQRARKPGVGVNSPLSKNLSKSSRVTFKSPVDSEFASPNRSKSGAQSQQKRGSGLTAASSATFTPKGIAAIRASLRDSSAYDFGSLWGSESENSAFLARTEPDSDQEWSPVGSVGSTDMGAAALSKGKPNPFTSSSEFRSADLHRTQILLSPGQHVSMSFTNRTASSAKRQSFSPPRDSAQAATRGLDGASPQQQDKLDGSASLKEDANSPPVRLHDLAMLASFQDVQPRSAASESEATSSAGIAKSFALHGEAVVTALEDPAAVITAHLAQTQSEVDPVRSLESRLSADVTAHKGSPEAVRMIETTFYQKEAPGADAAGLVTNHLDKLRGEEWTGTVSSSKAVRDLAFHLQKTSIASQVHPKNDLIAAHRLSNEGFGQASQSREADQTDTHKQSANTKAIDPQLEVPKSGDGDVTSWSQTISPILEFSENLPSPRSASAQATDSQQQPPGSSKDRDLNGDIDSSMGHDESPQPSDKGLRQSDTIKLSETIELQSSTAAQSLSSQANSVRQSWSSGTSLSVSVTPMLGVAPAKSECMSNFKNPVFEHSNSPSPAFQSQLSPGAAHHFGRVAMTASLSSFSGKTHAEAPRMTLTPAARSSQHMHVENLAPNIDLSPRSTRSLPASAMKSKPTPEQGQNRPSHRSLVFQRALKGAKFNPSSPRQPSETARNRTAPLEDSLRHTALQSKPAADRGGAENGLDGGAQRLQSGGSPTISLSRLQTHLTDARQQMPPRDAAGSLEAFSSPLGQSPPVGRSAKSPEIACTPPRKALSVGLDDCSQNVLKDNSASDGSWPSTLEFSVCSSPAILKEIESALQQEHSSRMSPSQNCWGQQRSDSSLSPWKLWEDFKQGSVSSDQDHRLAQSSLKPLQSGGSAPSRTHEMDASYSVQSSSNSCGNPGRTTPAVANRQSSSASRSLNLAAKGIRSFEHTSHSKDRSAKGDANIGLQQRGKPFVSAASSLRGSLSGGSRRTKCSQASRNLRQSVGSELAGDLTSCQTSVESKASFAGRSGGSPGGAAPVRSLLSSLNTAAEASRIREGNHHRTDSKSRGDSQSESNSVTHAAEHTALAASQLRTEDMSESMMNEHIMTKQQLAEAERECSQLMGFIASLKQQLEEHESQLPSEPQPPRLAQLPIASMQNESTPQSKEVATVNRPPRPGSGRIAFQPGVLESVRNKTGNLRRIAAQLSSRGPSSDSNTNRSSSTSRCSSSSTSPAIMDLGSSGKKRGADKTAKQDSDGSWEAGCSTPPAHCMEDVAALAKTTGKPISKNDWSRQRLWWRARLRAAEGEASRLKLQLSELQQREEGGGVQASKEQKSLIEADCAKFAEFEGQLAAKDWLLMQLQEQMQEAEEQSAQLLQDSHARLQDCERDFAAAMREAEAQIAESALAEEHMSNQLHDAHLQIEELIEEVSSYRNYSPVQHLHGREEMLRLCD